MYIGYWYLIVSTRRYFMVTWYGVHYFVDFKKNDWSLDLKSFFYYNYLNVLTTYEKRFSAVYTGDYWLIFD